MTALSNAYGKTLKDATIDQPNAADTSVRGRAAIDIQGSGDVAYPTAGSMTSLIVRVIVANIMATFPAIGYRSIFYSIPIGWTCGTAIVFIRYLTGKWKTKGVVRSNAQNTKEEAVHG